MIFLSLLLLSFPLFSLPPTPWAAVERADLPPSQPNEDYTPVIVPNGSTLPYHLVDGVKVFHLTAEPIVWQIGGDLTVHTWGYNGSVPGPVIEAGVGDRVRIYVTNSLPAPTSLHWHGMLLPCGMDGVAALTQPAIPPGETFLYEFFLPASGTFMYHSHYDSMTQEGLGLIGMFIVHEREKNPASRPDRDFVILLHEMEVSVGMARPDPSGGKGFNIFTMNGKVMPYTEPLVAELGERVWIRFGNLSAMDHHPIHLHGYAFQVIGTDGGWAPRPDLLLPETTVLVPVGATRVISFFTNNPGDWLFHCHMTHHTMNQMGHDTPNMLSVDTEGVEEKIRALIPGYMPMGVRGMRDMVARGMAVPSNSIPMVGFRGQFGQTVLGGMANVLRVRESLALYEENPGPYHFSEKTSARPVTRDQVEQDGLFGPVKEQTGVAAPKIRCSFCP